jgi:hypothetical protein
MELTGLQLAMIVTMAVLAGTLVVAGLGLFIQRSADRFERRQGH